MAVTQMQLAQTQLEVISAVATLGSLEMDIHVQVSKQSCSSALKTTRLHVILICFINAFLFFRS